MLTNIKRTMESFPAELMGLVKEFIGPERMTKEEIQEELEVTKMRLRVNFEITEQIIDSFHAFINNLLNEYGPNIRDKNDDFFKKKFPRSFKKILKLYREYDIVIDYLKEKFPRKETYKYEKDEDEDDEEEDEDEDEEDDEEEDEERKAAYQRMLKEDEEEEEKERIYKKDYEDYSFLSFFIGAIYEFIISKQTSGFKKVDFSVLN